MENYRSIDVECFIFVLPIVQVFMCVYMCMYECVLYVLYFSTVTDYAAISRF